MIWRGVQVGVASGGRVRATDGFSLVEALIAMTIATIVTLATAQLTVMSARAAHRAGELSTTAVHAEARLQQLQSLPWWFVDSPGGTLEPRSDNTTDLAREPFGVGGRGLSPGPLDALLNSAPGYADYLDRSGRVLGTAGTGPVSVHFVRRWSVLASPDDPADTLVLGVRVTPISTDLAVRDPAVARLLPGETWLVTLRTRTRP